MLEALTAASGCVLGATVTVGVLALQQRMRALHMLAHFDHVLLLCETDGANLTEYKFPGITVIGLNCSDIKHTVAPHQLGLWVATFPKLLALGLTGYHKILLVDMDVLLVADPTQVVVETKAPAMVEWQHFPIHEFNSGVLLIEPSRQLYRDALATLVAGTRDGWNQTARAIELWQLLQNEAGAPHKVVVGDAARARARARARASIFNSDQEFLYAFFEYIYRKEYGPVHAMAYEMNACHEVRAPRDAISPPLLTLLPIQPVDAASPSPDQHHLHHTSPGRVMAN